MVTKFRLPPTQSQAADSYAGNIEISARQPAFATLLKSLAWGARGFGKKKLSSSTRIILVKKQYSGIEKGRIFIDRRRSAEMKESYE